MSKPEISINELIETLKRTNLPTVLVEGSDDMIVFRKIEERIKNKNTTIDILPVGGRSKIIEIFRRKHEIPTDKIIVFVADKDYWVVTGIPEEFIDSRIIFTHGYSIENDTIIDGNLIDLLSEVQKIKFSSEVDVFLKWYAYELNRHIQDPSIKISVHPNNVLDMPHLTKGGLDVIPDYPHQMLSLLHQNYLTHIRGKSLMGLLIRNTGHGNKSCAHNHRSLLATVAARPGDLISGLENSIELSVSA